MAKSVLSKIEAESIAIAYSPRKFPGSVSVAAAHFIAHKSDVNIYGQSSGFQLDPLVAQQTGVAELERVAVEKRIEAEALERLKDLQEDAYAQAYQVGREEGRQKAYQDHQDEMKSKLNDIERTIVSIETLKSDLVTNNEASLVSLTYQIARQIAMGEVRERPEMILDVIRKAAESAGADEEIVIRVSPDDTAFVMSMREKLGKEFEFIKKAKLEVGESVTNGGCIIETNYGAVDATVEQRTKKVWDAICEKLPQINDKLSSADGEQT